MGRERRVASTPCNLKPFLPLWPCSELSKSGFKWGLHLGAHGSTQLRIVVLNYAFVHSFWTLGTSNLIAFTLWSRCFISSSNEGFESSWTQPPSQKLNDIGAFSSSLDNRFSMRLSIIFGCHNRLGVWRSHNFWLVQTQRAVGLTVRRFLFRSSFLRRHWVRADLILVYFGVVRPSYASTHKWSVPEQSSH